MLNTNQIGSDKVKDPAIGVINVYSLSLYSAQKLLPICFRAMDVKD